MFGVFNAIDKLSVMIVFLSPQMVWTGCKKTWLPGRSVYVGIADEGLGWSSVKPLLHLAWEELLNF